MESNETRRGFEKPVVDEAYIMHLMSGGKPDAESQSSGQQDEPKGNKPRERTRVNSQKKMNYEELF